jgi:hypothetical protein
MGACLIRILLAALSPGLIHRAAAGPLEPQSQALLALNVPAGHNELYYPKYDNPVPGKIAWDVKESVNYFEKHVNGSGGGHARRSSCPAVNTLANRGYIARSGRNISYEEIAQAARDVYNFGDDNVHIQAYSLVGES